MFELFDWQIFFLLLFAGFLGLLSVLPAQQSFLDIAGKKGKPKSNVFARRCTNIVFMTAVLSVAIYGGLVLSQHLGLPGTPFLEHLIIAPKTAITWHPIIFATLSGFGLGVLLSVSTLIGTRQVNQAFYGIALWKHLLAGLFHGGIVEELLFRWFLLLLLAWSISLVFGYSAIPLSDQAFWTANIVAALLFGLAHVPASVALAPLTPANVMLTLSMNGVAGVVYGYFLTRFGLETAILAHMSTHVTLQPFARMLLGLRKTRTASNKTLQIP